MTGKSLTLRRVLLLEVKMQAAWNVPLAEVLSRPSWIYAIHDPSGLPESCRGSCEV